MGFRHWHLSRSDGEIQERAREYSILLLRNVQDRGGRNRGQFWDIVTWIPAPASHSSEEGRKIADTSEVFGSGSSGALNILWDPVWGLSLPQNPYPHRGRAPCPRLHHRLGYINTEACNFKTQVVGWTTRQSVLSDFEVWPISFSPGAFLEALFVKVFPSFFLSSLWLWRQHRGERGQKLGVQGHWGQGVHSWPLLPPGPALCKRPLKSQDEGQCSSSFVPWRSHFLVPLFSSSGLNSQGLWSAI